MSEAVGTPNESGLGSESSPSDQGDGAYLGKDQQADIDLILKSGYAGAQKDRPFLIAIDGRSASGKSTLGLLLAKRADVALVHTDDFYRAMEPSIREVLSPAEGVAQYFDWQRLRDEVLTPVANGGTPSFRTYNWDENALGETMSVPVSKIVVVEGVYSARTETQAFFDLIVLVDTPEELRLRRQDKRNQSPSAWRDRWRAAEDLYFGDPLAHAKPDVIVRGWSLDVAAKT